MALSLHADVMYTEDELVRGLGCTRSWLQRNVKCTGRRGRQRLFLGADLIEKMRPTWRRSDGAPCVYFIRCSDFIKIGFATNVEERIDQLQTANPYTLELLGSVPGSLEDETTMHARFASLRVRGEWFHAAPELLDFIATVKR